MTGPAAGRLGMRLLVASLSMLFGATLTGYLLVRSRAPAWPPPGVPALPAGLLVSTVLILACSGAIWAASDGIRRGEERALRLGLLAALALAGAFLASQTVCWFSLVARSFTVRTNLYGFLFYLLTGLHALHVVAGLGPLAVTTARAWKGRYTAASHEGVSNVALYWHFLDAVWLVLFLVLAMTS